MARILIAGGGIGGLATALSTAARGHQVTVLERRAEFTELGAGIQLAPNAFHALDTLGVGQAVRDRAVFVDALRVMDGTTDRTLTTMRLTEDYRSQFGNPYAVVHRSDLYQPLLDACRDKPSVELRVDSPVMRYDQDEHGVTAVLGSGERVDGDVLVAADGIRSTVRGQLVGDGEPRVSGHTIYRSVIPMDRVPPALRSNTVTLWAGPKWHFVHYPIGGGRQLNLAATRDDGATEALVGVPARRDHVLGQFIHLGHRARRLLELGEQWRSWVLCDRDPVREWVDGRVVLLGDAAHPMLQYAAQGACMALEDAVLLGTLLDHDADLPPRLARFRDERRDRTAKAQRVSRAIGNSVYHPRGEAAAARNALLTGMSQVDLRDEVAWLHGARRFDAAVPLP
ncbi:3-hydroxybenzoate 6-monooxygenase [Actinokineospora sp. NBRC 105648]|uniref:3-hydroxybenzoate 6-monooxygenase n=1 Tax=Actinokineospora sp. NBRC 105648 TaxID=3032206 RepID=UPI0024A187BD|nr:3-hydroxybenzoate 6-monooxygenase [Actinokineospora sp. NBRC 105648]GLZ36594.1 putative monooxygenase [Actinokineospora sp. NBRC 105648]